MNRFLMKTNINKLNQWNKKSRKRILNKMIRSLLLKMRFQLLSTLMAISTRTTTRMDSNINLTSMVSTTWIEKMRFSTKTTHSQTKKINLMKLLSWPGLAHSTETWQLKTTSIGCLQLTSLLLRIASLRILTTLWSSLLLHSLSFLCASRSIFRCSLSEWEKTKRFSRTSLWVQSWFKLQFNSKDKAKTLSLWFSISLCLSTSCSSTQLMSLTSLRSSHLLSTLRTQWFELDITAFWVNFKFKPLYF